MNANVLEHNPTKVVTYPLSWNLIDVDTGSEDETGEAADVGLEKPNSVEEDYADEGLLGTRNVGGKHAVGEELTWAGIQEQETIEAFTT
eukprot:560726-Amphidinium_carterae.1